MNQHWLSVDDIVKLMEALQTNNMGSLELQNGDQAIQLKNRETVVAAAPAAAATAPVALAPDTAPAPAEASAADNLAGAVKAPIVGTFYAAPAPDKPPFVQVGSQVNKGDVLFIIESMKLMNEVLSETSGTVTKILVENAQPVEYGQPILCIE